MYKTIVSLTLLLFITNSYAQDSEMSDAVKYIQQMKEQMTALADNLDECKEFKQEFLHPFNGEKMQRNIMGVVEEKCLYSETMPNNGKMECKYTEVERKAIAQQYRDMASAQEQSMRVQLEGSTAEPQVKTTYTINGKEVDNPLQQAMDDGVCVISGYE